MHVVSHAFKFSLGVMVVGRWQRFAQHGAGGRERYFSSESRVSESSRSFYNSVTDDGLKLGSVAVHLDDGLKSAY